MARNYSNTTVETTLANSIGSGDTSMQINDTGGLPASFPYSLVLDPEGSSTEVVTVTNLSGGTLTITRGQDGTAAQSHSSGEVVIHGVTARDLSEPQEHIDATAQVHGLPAGSDMVGTTATQTLTNKTINAPDNTITNIAGSSLASSFDATGVDATFDSVTLAGPDPDVNVATELASHESDITELQKLGRIATEIATTDSATFDSTETEVMSITASLVEGRIYEVWSIARWGSDTTGDQIVARLREDNLTGTLMQQGQIESTGTSTLGFGPVVLYGEYTATTTGNKTFSLTGDRNFGSGNCRMDASASTVPAYLFVNYSRDA